MRKYAFLQRCYSVFYAIFHLYRVTAFCSGDRSGINVTFLKPKNAHVTWDVSHTTCSPPVVGYIVHYNFVFNQNTIYKSTDVTGERTNSADIPLFPSFQYSIYVSPRSNAGELPNPKPEFSNFTAKKEVPSVSPSGIALLNVGDTKMSLKWDKLNPFQKNGKILGYMIYYKSSKEKSSHGMKITGENTLTTTLTSLIPESTYSIYINAVGEVGAGPYNNPPFIVKTRPSVISSTAAVVKPYVSTYKLTTSVQKTNPRTTNSVIPTASNSITHLYIATTTGFSRRSLPSKTISALPSKTISAQPLKTIGTIKANNYMSSSSNTPTVATGTTKVSEPEPDNRWDRILLIVGIAFGVLLLIAICIPIILHFCGCCGKDSVGSGKTSQEEEEKSQLHDKNGIQSIKNETNRPYPMSRHRRHSSNLSRKMSYKWEPDGHYDLTNGGSDDKFENPIHKSRERGEMYNEIDLESIPDDGELSVYDSGIQYNKKTHNSEFRFWPEIQNVPNKSRLIDSWRIRNVDDYGNTYPQFPPGFLHTNINGLKPRFIDQNTNSKINSGHPRILKGDLQSHPRTFIGDDQYRKNNNIELETLVGSTNGNILQPQSGEIDKDRSYLERNNKLRSKNKFDTKSQAETRKPYNMSMDEKENDLSLHKSKSPEEIFNDSDKEKTNKNEDKINNIFHKKLKNTNNVYIHNFMAFKGIFSRHPKHAQVDPIESPTSDDESNPDDMEVTGTGKNNQEYGGKDSKTKLRAIIYEPV